MKGLRYYEEKNKTLLEETIKLDLKTKPVPISVDCIIKIEEDLELPSVQFAIRRAWRRAAQVEFIRAKNPTHRFLKCAPGAELNGIHLEDGIILPVFAPEVLEDSELSTQMMVEGLVLSLQTEFDAYYYKLLLSFDLSNVPEQIQEKIREWGNETPKEEK